MGADVAVWLGGLLARGARDEDLPTLPRVSDVDPSLRRLGSAQNLQPIPIPDPLLPFATPRPARAGRWRPPGRILAVFDAHQAQFRLVTRRAEARFLQRDWRGGQQDAAERLTLYRQFVGWCVQDLRRSLGDAGRGSAALGGAAAGLHPRGGPTGSTPSWRYTFFNSVVRQVLQAVGPEAGVYFDDARVPGPPAARRRPGASAYPAGRSLEAHAPRAARRPPLRGRLSRPGRRRPAARRAGSRRSWPAARGGAALEAIEVVPDALLPQQGRLSRRPGRDQRPGLCRWCCRWCTTSRDPGGRAPDHLGRGRASSSRSPGPTSTSSWSAPARWSSSSAPSCRASRIDELYTSLGYHKHGKTELVRALLRHMEAARRAVRGRPRATRAW